MKKNLSKVHESIKDSSMTELKDFLENIRKFSPKIGKVAMRHVIWEYCWNYSSFFFNVHFKLQTAEQLNIDITANESAIKRFISPTISGNIFQINYLPICF